LTRPYFFEQKNTLPISFCVHVGFIQAGYSLFSLTQFFSSKWVKSLVWNNVDESLITYDVWLGNYQSKAHKMKRIKIMVQVLCTKSLP
jgi:hypothetical protein